MRVSFDCGSKSAFLTHKDEDDEEEDGAKVGQHGQGEVDGHDDVVEASCSWDELEDAQDSEHPENGQCASGAWSEKVKEDTLRVVW